MDGEQLEDWEDAGMWRDETSGCMESGTTFRLPRSLASFILFGVGYLEFGVGFFVFAYWEERRLVLGAASRWISALEF
jgi:hypothetical protein